MENHDVRKKPADKYVYHMMKLCSLEGSLGFREKVTTKLGLYVGGEDLCPTQKSKQSTGV